jgi:hypothetical protein
MDDKGSYCPEVLAKLGIYLHDHDHYSGKGKVIGVVAAIQIHQPNRKYLTKLEKANEKVDPQIKIISIDVVKEGLLHPPQSFSGVIQEKIDQGELKPGISLTQNELDHLIKNEVDPRGGPLRNLTNTDKVIINFQTQAIIREVFGKIIEKTNKIIQAANLPDRLKGQMPKNLDEDDDDYES